MVWKWINILIVRSKFMRNINISNTNRENWFCVLHEYSTTFNINYRIIEMTDWFTANLYDIGSKNLTRTRPKTSSDLCFRSLFFSPLVHERWASCLLAIQPQKLVTFFSAHKRAHSALDDSFRSFSRGGCRYLNDIPFREILFCRRSDCTILRAWCKGVGRQCKNAPLRVTLGWERT